MLLKVIIRNFSSRHGVHRAKGGSDDGLFDVVGSACHFNLQMHLALFPSRVSRREKISSGLQSGF